MLQLQRVIDLVSPYEDFCSTFFNHISHQNACTYIWSNGCFQGLREHTITGGYDLLLSTTWQPWPSLRRLENCHLGHASLMPGNSFQTDAPTACGSYPLLLSAKQNVLLHQ
jgi:hypothetical protein